MGLPRVGTFFHRRAREVLATIMAMPLGEDVNAGYSCPPSAPVRQIERIEEGRISGSS